MSLARRILLANPSVQVSSLLRGGFATPSAKLTTDSSHANYSPSQGGTKKFLYKSETHAHVAPGFNVTAPSVATIAPAGDNYDSGYSNSGTAGYTSGGIGTNGAATPHQVMLKITFSNETGSKLSTTLSKTNFTHGSDSESGTAGYVFGGANAAFSTRYNTVEKMPFGTETNAVMGSSFTALGNAASVFSNGSLDGYMLGGEDQTIGRHNRYNRLTYATSTFTNNFAQVSAYSAGGFIIGGALSNDGTAGYVCGGSDGTNRDLIQKMTYASHTNSTLSATLVLSTIQINSNPDYYQNTGYLVTGYVASSTGVPASTNIGFVNKLPYSTETRSVLHAGAISSGRVIAVGHIDNNGAGRG
jgi:hypothetical protein